MADEKKEQHKILIEFIFRINRKFSFKKFRFPIQNQPFEFGLRIKNNDNKIFPGCTIKKFQIISLDNKDLRHEFEEEFSIRKLNPDEKLEIWWPEPLSTYLEGRIWLSCSVIPNEPSKEEIETYQCDRNTGVISKYKLNLWGDSSYIEGKFELEQSRTNLLILFLTILTFLEGLFGLKEIALWLLVLLRSVLASFLGVIDLLLKT